MESISRISSLMETARDLTLEAARDASVMRKPSSGRAPSLAQLKKLLDSRNEREVLEGLRRVISLSHRRPSPTGPPLLFSSVLKNIASPSLPVKKLVYIYLLAHAETEPDTALLAINTIQKTLSASDPHLRALALRVMSGIRVPVISQIVSLGIKKGCADMSPLVRKAAALAIPKCWRLDPGTAPQLLEYLSLLLGDRQYFVAGAAVIAFMEVCPERIDLIHKHYRGLIRKLVDMDEWAQLATLRLMTSYARHCFPQRTKRARKSAQEKTSTKGFYGDETPDRDEGGASPAEFEEVTLLDPDLELLLKAALPLLQSRNSAVITAVTRCYLYLAPPTSPYLSSAIGPLISLLRSPQDTQQIALYNIIQVALVLPAPFVRHATHFLLRSTDPPQLHRPKLELLTLVFPHAPPHLQSLILSELSHFSRSTSPALIQASVRAIGRCAHSTPPGSPTATRCLRLLLTQLESPSGALVAESLTVIRHLIQADPGAHVATVTRLAKTLDSLTNPQARATVIWLVGEFAGVDDGDNVAADVLRLLARGFADEAEPAKLQILLLAAKVYVHYLNAEQQVGPHQKSSPATQHPAPDASQPATLASPGDIGGFSETNPPPLAAAAADDNAAVDHPIPLLWHYILHLTRYDTSYDLRDRARLYKALLSTPTSTQLASLLLLAPKPAPTDPSPSEARRGFTLGSASLVVGPDAGDVGFRGYEAVPEWVEEGREPDPRMREEGGVGVVYGDVKMLSASERLEAQGSGTGAGWGARSKANGEGGGAAEKSLDDWLAEGEDGIEESDVGPEDEVDGESDESTEESEESEESEEESDGDEDDERANLVK